MTKYGVTNIIKCIKLLRELVNVYNKNLLGRIPEEDETPSVRYGGVEFTVLLTEDNWISKIKAVYLNEKTREDEG